MSVPLTVKLVMKASLLHLTLNRPKANIVDAEMINALHTAIEKYSESPDLKAIIVDAEGPHFSFGASVEEHMPDQCADMVKGLHALIISMSSFQAKVSHPAF